ncbi:type II toxin-antitoxin system antitoxin VapB26 [soil metagenome]
MYGMQKTTLYLPDELKVAVEREARQRGVSEAQVIRQAIADAVVRPAPRGGLFASREPMADRVDELLVGFGER